MLIDHQQKNSKIALVADSKFDREFWEQLWSNTLREHPDKVARRAPNASLVAQLANLPPGRALDAGCGHGAESLWLAARGWQVVAVDFSAAALAQGRATALAAGEEIAARIDWIEGDLASWKSEPERYDLVVCLHVHIAGPVEEMVRRMAEGVAPGGMLFLAGHRSLDPDTGVATATTKQVQVSVESAVAALEPAAWEFITADERPRVVNGPGIDSVICARRRT